jgi:4-hydroxy-4-methyl-2-oxoglutarate aldolase
MPERLSKEQLDALAQIDTPTISNIIELFGVRSPLEGFSSVNIRCTFPERKPVVGYAATAHLSAQAPRDEHSVDRFMQYIDHIAQTGAPNIAVCQDIDAVTGTGAWIGEIMSNMHVALGGVACVTNGSVRDLDEVAQTGYQVFACGPSPSHGLTQPVAVARPVVVGGMTVCPGDLIHGDKHGVVNIPLEIADKVASRLGEILEAERPVLEMSRSKNFSVEKYKKLFRTMLEKYT